MDTSSLSYRAACYYYTIASISINFAFAALLVLPTSVSAGLFALALILLVQCCGMALVQPYVSMARNTHQIINTVVVAIACCIMIGLIHDLSVTEIGIDGSAVPSILLQQRLSSLSYALYASNMIYVYILIAFILAAVSMISILTTYRMCKQKRGTTGKPKGTVLVHDSDGSSSSMKTHLRNVYSKFSEPTPSFSIRSPTSRVQTQINQCSTLKPDADDLDDGHHQVEMMDIKAIEKHVYNTATLSQMQLLRADSAVESMQPIVHQYATMTQSQVSVASKDENASRGTSPIVYLPVNYTQTPTPAQMNAVTHYHQQSVNVSPLLIGQSTSLQPGVITLTQLLKNDDGNDAYATIGATMVLAEEKEEQCHTPTASPMVDTPSPVAAVGGMQHFDTVPAPMPQLNNDLLLTTPITNDLVFVYDE